MATLLLIIIYIAFIGLGIPDSIFGTAWPAIYIEFGIPVSWANFVTLIISGCTIIASLFSARLIRKFGTATITAVSTTLTAIALLGFSFSKNIIWLCGFSIPLGLGAGAIDTALNNYVALHYKATHMNFLHCFYGIGVSLSPYLMSLALSDGQWRNGYRIVFWIQLGISILTILSFPLWKKVQRIDNGETSTQPETNVGFFKLLKTPKVLTACMVFFCSCAMEYTCGVWGSTFLVNAKNFNADTAAMIVMFYYIGIALGRFISGLLANKLSSGKIITIGQAITLLAIILIVLPFHPIVSCVGIAMVGLGNGPLFPNMLHLTPERFGKELSQSVMGVQMAASYIGILLAPILFGLIADYVSATLFPYYLLVMYAIMIVGTLLCNRNKQKRNTCTNGENNK